MLTITYDKLRKSARINGRLARHSVETAGVVDTSSTGLAAGEVCLHDSQGRTWAVWAIEGGEVECDTRRSGAHDTQSWQQFEMRVKDSSGNLLGRGCVEVVESCAGHDDSLIGVSGGPMVLEAAARIEAGWPVALKTGMAQPCQAGEHEQFVGIALETAEIGETVEVQRWGAVWIDAWGLEPGTRYWLPQNAGELAAEPADVVLLVGVAQDADTLVLTGGRVAVQPHAVESGEVYARWSREERRLVEVKPIEAGGSEAAGKIPRLDSDGLLDPTMIPVTPLITLARKTISDVVQNINMGANPTYAEVLATIYLLLTALRTADQAPVAEGSLGDEELPEFRGIIDDSQQIGDTQTTWSSAKILSYVVAFAGQAIKVLPDVADEASLPDPTELERASICYVVEEAAQYWCSGPFGAWERMGSEAPTITQMNAAIEAATGPIEEDVEELQEDVEELQGDVGKLQEDVEGLEASKADATAINTALGLRYTKSEVDGLLGDKADATPTSTALGLRYTKSEVDGILEGYEYEQNQWEEVSVKSIHVALTEGTKIKAYKRSGIIVVNAILQTASGITHPIQRDQTLFVLDGVTIVGGQHVVWFDFVGSHGKAYINADGSVVTWDWLIRTAYAGQVGANPHLLKFMVACE